MSTTVSTPTGTTVTTTTGAHAYFEFLKVHETLIIAIGTILLVLFLGNKWLNNRAAVAVAQYDAAKQALVIQVTANEQLAKQATDQAAQYQKLLAQVTAQNAALVTQINHRDQAVIVQQQALATLPLPQVGARWVQLLDVPPATVVYTTSGLLVSDDTARKTVQELELVPVLKADNADLQKISSGKDQQLVQLTALNTTLNSQIGGLNLQIVDEQKACSTQVTAIKATAAKSKRNWFLTGLGIGGTVAAYLVLTL